MLLIQNYYGKAGNLDQVIKSLDRTKFLMEQTSEFLTSRLKPSKVGSSELSIADMSARSYPGARIYNSKNAILESPSYHDSDQIFQIEIKSLITLPNIHSLCRWK